MSKTNYKGLVCPFCGYGDTRVNDSRKQKGKNIRYRRCIACGGAFATIEVYKYDLLPIKFSDRKEISLNTVRRMLKKHVQSAEDIENILLAINDYYVNQVDETTEADFMGTIFSTIVNIDIKEAVDFYEFEVEKGTNENLLFDFVKYTKENENKIKKMRKILSI